MPAISRVGGVVMLPLMLVGLLSGLFMSASPADAVLTRTKVHHAVDISLNQIGDPYVYGAAGPGAFDCSGLIYYSYRKAGFKHMPRTSSAQASWLRHIKKSNMRRGDLMYFYDGGGVYHAAIFLKWSKRGRAVMLDAPYPGRDVNRHVAWTSQWYARTIRR